MSPSTRRTVAGLVLFASILLPAQAAVAFLVQGCWAVFGGQLFGFPAMGIEPAEGDAAVRIGVFMILGGLFSAVIAFFGLKWSLRELRHLKDKA